MREFLSRLTLDGAIAPIEPLVPIECFEGTCLQERRFAFYGESIAVPDPIDWDLNPGSAHWGHDLNRFGFLILYDSGRIEEALAMRALIFDWIEKNDRELYAATPYAWQNLLNVAIRMENWLRFVKVAVVRDGLTLSRAERRAISLSLVRHFQIALRLLRGMGFASNAALIALRAAFFVLAAMPTFPRRGRYWTICENFLKRSIAAQILSDGVQHELSPHYHWVALELLSSIGDLYRQSGAVAPSILDDVAARMLYFIEALRCPDDSLVSLGDSDAAYGARIWTFVDALRERFSASARLSTVCEFPYAGIAVVRDAASGSLLAFDGGPFGVSHQHEDKLSFWFTAFGTNIVIDPGRFRYEYGPQSVYAYLRSTHAHSTITVDGEGQNARANRAGWRGDAPVANLVSQEGGVVHLYGSYEEGYGANLIPVRHHRTLKRMSPDPDWTIGDRLDGEGAHLIESRFHLAPCKWRLSPGLLEADFEGVIATLRFDSGFWERARVDFGGTNPWSGWWSPRINALKPSPTLVLATRRRLPVETEIRMFAVRSRGC